MKRAAAWPPVSLPAAFWRTAHLNPHPLPCGPPAPNPRGKAVRRTLSREPKAGRTDRQRDRETDRRTDGQRDRETGRQTERQRRTDRGRERQTDSETDRQREKETDRQTERQMDRETPLRIVRWSLKKQYPT